MTDAAMPPLFLNGKFTAQPLTGVQRAAQGWVCALDRRLAAAPPSTRWVLLCPPGGTPPPLARIEVRRSGPRGPLALWEQAWLPFAARGGWLLNLSGSAPLLASRQVCTLHDAAVFDHPEAYTRLFASWYRFLFTRLAPALPVVLTVSEFSRGRLAERLRLPLQHFAVVPNGADHLDALAPDERVLDRLQLRGRRYLLAVGSANPTKNQQRLLQAFGEVCRDRDDVLLVVVARRHRAVFAQAGAAALAAASGPVREAPDPDDAELKALYRHASALVFPSLYEGFGLPAVEAMACGCPVLAADAGALPEVCGDAALGVDPRRVDAIAGAMRRLLDEPALREQLRARGHARVRTMTWDAAARRLLAHLAARRLPVA